ncbi:sigma-70 family RNA polymerase sigma factor [Microbacterium panaciterrae]|uniref:RNA polymerase sigma factor n=1 Tax=Microbacterium panaciterrae TaxID=985759 RepID=A0ABP8P6S9_9MICO
MTDDAPVESETDAAPDERALFAQVQRGDRDALRVIYKRHSRPVYWAAHAVLSSKSDAEEVLQDTFMTFWNKRAAITIVADSTLPWLITTARYLALNRKRSEARKASVAFDDTTDVADATPSVEERAINDEALTIIHDSMSRTSPLDQQIFKLCMVEDLSYKQAAYQLGVSHASVRNRLSRLRLRLRIELDTLKGDDER